MKMTRRCEVEDDEAWGKVPAALNAQLSTPNFQSKQRFAAGLFPWALEVEMLPGVVMRLP